MLPTNYRRGERVKVQSDQLRAITYGPTGQRVVAWLPAGEWQIEGVGTVALDPDRNTFGDGIVMFRPADFCGVWYVHPSALPEG